MLRRGTTTFVGRSRHAVSVVHKSRKRNVFPSNEKRTLPVGSFGSVSNGQGDTNATPVVLPVTTYRVSLTPINDVHRETPARRPIIGPIAAGPEHGKRMTRRYSISSHDFLVGCRERRRYLLHRCSLTIHRSRRRSPRFVGPTMQRVCSQTYPCYHVLQLGLRTCEPRE